MLPLMRASQLLPFADHLAEADVDPHAALTRCMCPAYRHLGKLDCIIPTSRLWEFVERGSSLLGDINFGWDVAMRFGVYGGGRFAYALEHQPTLGDALAYYAANIPTHASVSRGALEQREGYTWFYRATTPRKGSPYFQVEQYALGTLLHIVRCYLGSDWRPQRIVLTAAAQEQVQLAISGHCEDIAFGASRAAIEIPNSMLDQPPRPIGNAAPPAPQPPTFPCPAFDTLVAMLNYYVPEYPLTLASVSAITQLHPKTLNRRLAAEGRTFREVRTEVLMSRACAEIKRGGLSMQAISDLLGYANQSAFSRAFRAAFGVSPSAYASAQQ